MPQHRRRHCHIPRHRCWCPSVEITFTYRNVSSTVKATFVAATIPSVAVVQTSVPVVSQPQSVYLTTQTISLGSAVTYTGNVTYTWFRGANTTNDEVLGNGRAISFSASTLDLSSTDGTMVENRIFVVVADAADPTVFGEAALILYVLPSYDLTLNVANINSFESRPCCV